MSPGNVALMRVAALPMAWFARGGAPELAEALRQWDHDRDRLAVDGVALADAIGDVVPHRAFGPAERAGALAARRLLHALPDPIPHRAAATIRTAAELADRAGEPGLGSRLRRTARALADLAGRHARLNDAVDAEQRRLQLPWPAVTADPVARLAVSEAHPDAVADIETRLRMGEAWPGKRLRQRAELLWRLIIRGSTRATPRGWLAHTALLEVAPAAALPELTGDHAVEFAANRHDGTGLAELATPGALLAVAPLRRDSATETTVWVIDSQAPDRMRELRLNRTEPLRAVLRALDGGTLSLDQLIAAVEPDLDRQSAHGFIEHLVQLGVVTVSRPASATVTGWSARAGALPRPPASCFVDVHRRPHGPLPLTYARRVEELVGRALRVLDVVGSGPPPSAADLPETPRPVLDLLAADLTCAPNTSRQRWDWPAPGSADTPYRRLHDWLSTRLDAGPVDLDDAVDAPNAPLSWPVDCVVRPVRPDGAPLAVLDQVRPAGLLDARFADALAVLHPAGRAWPAWYRTFLRQIERDLGGRFVELLVPPLSRTAANAVRRPAYTGAWTGDPDVGRYYGPERPRTYVPLSELTIRQLAGAPVVEARGEPVWPVYHSMRVLPQPWDLIGARLQGASPRANRAPWRRLHYSLTGWPDRDRMPRITVGGGQLVLTPAQWRLRSDELWGAHAAMPDAARALTRLRTAKGLPRWVTVAAGPLDEPRAADLDSLLAVRLLDRARRGGATELLVAEMLPAPDTPGGPAHHSELVLRLPLAADPIELAQTTTGTAVPVAVKGN